MAALETELGEETTMVGADTVWLIPGRFDKGIRVEDAASRRAATDAVFRTSSATPSGSSTGCST